MSSTSQSQQLAKPAVQPLAAAAVPPRNHASIWQRFRKHRLAMIGMIILGVLIILAIGAPIFAPDDPNQTNIRFYRKGPSAAHILGNDSSGRDVWSRLLRAGRISLSVGLVAVTIYTAIGLALGALAGYYGGWVDSVIMRFADIVLAFPSLIIIITVVSVLGPSVWNVMLVIGLLGWPPIARILRGQFLSLRERDFVLASRTIGTPNRRIITRHLLPNALAPIIVAATFGMASAILLEAGLSFLGLGIEQPTASWGNLLAAAPDYYLTQPWLMVWPGLFILMTTFAFNLLGDGLRDAFDPRARI